LIIRIFIILLSVLFISLPIGICNFMFYVFIVFFKLINNVSR
jgi:hypothetical protein